MTDLSRHTVSHLSSLVKPSSFKESHKTEKTGDSSHTNPPLSCNTQQYAAQITLIQNTNMHLGTITGPRRFPPPLHPSLTTPPCPWNPRWGCLAVADDPAHPTIVRGDISRSRNSGSGDIGYGFVDLERPGLGSNRVMG